MTRDSKSRDHAASLPVSFAAEAKGRLHYRVAIDPHYLTYRSGERDDTDDILLTVYAHAQRVSLEKIDAIFIVAVQ